MSPHRVHILGASGAGTTTLARALAADLGIPVALVKNALGLSVSRAGRSADPPPRSGVCI